MSTTSAIVFFAVIWALVFYMVSPLWQRTQEEEGHVVPGTPPSAPAHPRLARKALVTTVVAVVIFSAAYYVIEWEIITAEDLKVFGPPNRR
ncbi:MAG: DUF1467 family protein [Pseudomonadota bacterium]